MSIRYVQGEMRALDGGSGEYLKTDFYHRDHPTRSYSIYAADGSKVLTGTVKQEDIDLSGDGRVGLHRITVLLIEEWSGEGLTVVADEHAPAAQKFARFMQVFLMDHPGKQGSAEINFDLRSGGGL